MFDVKTQDAFFHRASWLPRKGTVTEIPNGFTRTQVERWAQTHPGCLWLSRQIECSFVLVTIN